MLATPAAIAEAKAKFYAGKDESIMDVIKELEKDKSLGAWRPQRDQHRPGRPSTRWPTPPPCASSQHGVAAGHQGQGLATSISSRSRTSTRCGTGCDGVLYEMVPPPRHLAPAITSRIKVMSNLDIAERRLPQDGRIELERRRQPGRHPRRDPADACSARASSCGPRPHGRAARPEEARHARGHRCQVWRELIDKPNGIILVTGPTGSGKTTTLYCDPQRAEPHQRQDHHHRGAGRVRHRRPDPGADQPRDRRDLRRLPAGHPAAGPGQDPGGRDPRPGDGRDRRSRRR